MKHGETPGVFKRKLPSGELRWSYRYFYSGRWLRLAAPNNTMRSAQRALDDAKETIDRGGDPTKKRRKSITVAQVLKAYVETCRASKKRAIRRYQDFESSLGRHLGTRQTSAIDEDLLLTYRARRGAEKVSDATINRELAFLRAALNRAKQTGGVPSHFFEALQTREARRRIFPQEKPARGFQRLSDEDLEAIVAAFPEELRDVMRRASTLALLSGMRRSEVFGLEWPSVSSDRIRLTETKSGRAREIPLTKAMRDVLPPRHIDSGLVFRTREGERVPDGYDLWRQAAKDAGRPWVRFHDLRHEWASRYVEAGGDLVSLMEVGGWSSLSLVQRYAKASQDRIRLTLERIGNSTPDSTRQNQPAGAV
jgi:integrase